MIAQWIHRHRATLFLSIAAAFGLAGTAGAQASDDGVCVPGSPTGYATGIGVPYTTDGPAVGFQIVSIRAPLSRIVAQAPFDNRTFYDKAPRVGDSIQIPNDIGGNLQVKVFTSDRAGHGGAVCFKAQFRKR